MDQDHLYNRAMGLRYDPERAHRAVASGVVGYDGPLDRSNGFGLEGSDLYLETAGDERESRLGDIELELYELFKDPTPSEEVVEAVLMLEVEKTMLKEEIAIEVVANNPLDTERLMKELEKLQDDRVEALKDYLTLNLMEEGMKGAPIDEEMFEEADLLSRFIAVANPEKTPQGLVDVAKAMKEAIVARIELNRVLTA